MADDVKKDPLDAAAAIVKREINNYFQGRPTAYDPYCLDDIALEAFGHQLKGVPNLVDRVRDCRKH